MNEEKLTDFKLGDYIEFCWKYSSEDIRYEKGIVLCSKENPFSGKKVFIGSKIKKNNWSEIEREYLIPFSEFKYQTYYELGKDKLIKHKKLKDF